jgi:hypothetical protein
VAVGTLRYWAAARAAAGVAEEKYDAATLAEALAAARTSHGDDLARVLDRCSYVVDDAPVGGRAHDSVVLTDGGFVEVLPPFAGGSAPELSAPGVAMPASASDKVLTGLAAGGLAAGLAGLSLLGVGALAGGLFAVQIVIALAWLAVLDTRGRGGSFLILVVAAGVIDGVVGTEDSPDIGRAAGVLGVTVVVSLLHQLRRKRRRAVTLSISGTLSAVVLALAAASYLALHAERGGDVAVAAALFGTGAALAAARLTDLLLPRPAPVPGSRRGIAGLVVGLGAGGLVGWLYGSGRPLLGTDTSVRIALVAAVIALIADLAVDSVLHGAPPRDDRARSALPPLAVLLPTVLAAPAAYVAGRILLG